MFKYVNYMNGNLYLYYTYGPTGILNFSQPVYVQRDDRESRRYAILEIIRRVQIDQNWPQVKCFYNRDKIQ